MLMISGSVKYSPSGGLEAARPQAPGPSPTLREAPYFEVLQCLVWSDYDTLQNLLSTLVSTVAVSSGGPWVRGRALLNAFMPLLSEEIPALLELHSIT